MKWRLCVRANKVSVMFKWV